MRVGGSVFSPGLGSFVRESRRVVAKGRAFALAGRRGALAFAAVLIALVVASPPTAGAEPLAREDVPEPLVPWIDWVLRGHEEERCPFLQNEGARVCVWPGRLELVLDAKGGRFSEEVQVARAVEVPLPGGRGAWPQDVRVDGVRAAVVGGDGMPHVRLERGVRRIEGRFAWSEVPPGIAVPSEIGLVELTLEGRRVARPRRDAGGSLWLRDAQVAAVAAPAVENRVDVEVVRRFEDAVPPRLATLVRLRVSGESREERLGLALPSGWLATALSSPIPARLDPDGRLRVQLRPGDWTLRLDARQAVASLRLEQPKQGEGAVWDESEVWSIALAPELRLLELSGAPAIDPTQAELPGEWQSLPAHRLDARSTIELAEKRRGNEGSAGDQLALVRTWFLDFDGGGLTVLDRLTGTLRRSLRVEMSPETELGRVAIDGRDQPITRRAEQAGLGVETTLGPIALDADSRIESNPRRLSAVGWDLDVDQLSATLLVPPGYRLLHVGGVDSADTTWVSRWNLLSVFFVLLVTVVCLRLFGPLGAAWALVTLALVWNEPGAPARIWLALSVVEALRRAVAQGRFARLVALAQGTVVVVLVAVGAAFAVDQLRIGLFPALERPDEVAFARDARESMLGDVAPPTAPPMTEAAVAVVAEQDGAAASIDATAEALGQDVHDRKERLKRRLPAESRYGGSDAAYVAISSGGSRSYALEADPNATVPTGPGRPDWTWEIVSLSWSGPVTRDHVLSLWLVPPWVNALLSVLRVVAIVGLVAFFARGWRRDLVGGGGLGPLGLPLGFGGVTATTLAALVSRERTLVCVCAAAIGAAGLTPGSARADMPTPELLDALRSRLLESPSCTPSCAALPKLRVEVAPERLRLVASIDARAETGVALPGGGSGETVWLPESIEQDGTRATAIRRDTHGFLWLRVPAGVHEVVLEGALPPHESVQVSLPFEPQRIVVEPAPRGWTVAGIGSDGTSSGVLQLVRDAAAVPASSAGAGGGATPARPAGKGDGFEPSTILPFVELARRFELGLRWQVETSVRRIAPQDGPIVLEIPLAKGESVTTPGVRVEDGLAKLTLAAGETSARYASTLEIAPAIELLAPTDRPWSEVWLLSAAPVWHVETEGIPPVDRVEEGARFREWRPWPGEKLRLAIERPAGLEAATRTIDRAVLSLAPGARATDATLTLAMRSSQGGQHVVTLPEGAELTSLVVNGEAQPLRQEGRDVSVTLAPGSRQVVFGWREARGIRALFAGSEVGLGVPAVNATVELAVPEKRWLLYTMGPRLGPAVLFWSALAVVAGLAFLIARTGLTPLSLGAALLLGVGLTQASVFAGALVAGWFIGLGVRGRHAARLAALPPFAYRAVQIGFVLLTLAAASALTFAIGNGLLGTPDMRVAGNGSDGSLLRWYVDRSDPTLPMPRMFSLSIWWYRGVMLAWSMWLALALVEWARWGFEQWNRGGTFSPEPAPARVSEPSA